jgi:3-oxoacyl-[acyl-carrier protein] reductase
MDLELRGKVVMISGATGGIGSAICAAFLKESALIVPLYRNHSKYELLFEYLKKENLNVETIFPVETDLASSQSIEKAVKLVKERYGRIDILVNNAGASTERPFLMIEENEWEKEIDVNLNNTARLIRIVLKQMFIAKKGVVVNISSLLSQRFGRGVSAYAAAKAGIDRLTQALAMEVGIKGIRVNSVCPGIIETSMSKPLISRLGDNIIPQTALGRFGKPEEVAKAVLFLSSEITASYITGHLLRVDGGYGI